MRILVTGGRGFLAAELLEVAAAAGHELAATYHHRPPPGRVPDPAAGFAAAPIQWWPLELTEPRSLDELAAALSVFRPDAVVHTAYAATGDARIATDDGVAALVVATRAVGARLVHLSTDVVFDGALPTGATYREVDEPRPIHDYGRAKLAAEHAVRSLDPAAAVVRTSLIYAGEPAPGRELSGHEQAVLDALDGRAPGFVFFTDEWRNPVQVTDLARAVLELATSDSGRSVAGPIHVAGAEVVSRYGFARLVAQAHGRDPSRVPGGPSPAAARRPRNCALDLTMATTVGLTRLRGVAEVLAVRG